MNRAGLKPIGPIAPGRVSSTLGLPNTYKYRPWCK